MANQEKQDSRIIFMKNKILIFKKYLFKIMTDFSVAFLYVSFIFFIVNENEGIKWVFINLFKLSVHCFIFVYIVIFSYKSYKRITN